MKVRAWMNNYIPYKSMDVITYPHPYFVQSMLVKWALSFYQYRDTHYKDKTVLRWGRGLYLAPAEKGMKEYGSLFSIFS